MNFLKKAFGSGIPAINVNTYKSDYFQQDNHILIDVRTPGEFAQGHIPGARNVPLDELSAQALADIAQEQTVIVSCRSGSRSNIGAKKLIAAGYTNVHNLSGGMIQWQGHKLPVE